MSRVVNDDDSLCSLLWLLASQMDLAQVSPVPKPRGHVHVSDPQGQLRGRRLSDEIVLASIVCISFRSDFERQEEEREKEDPDLQTDRQLPVVRASTERL